MHRILRQGDQGQDVKALQDVLNFHLRRPPPLVVDGKFGPKTKARVVEFQKINKLQPDGAVGNFTRPLLYAVDVVPFSLALIPKGQSSTSSFGSPQRPPLVPPLVLQPIPPLVLPGTGIVIPGLPGSAGSTTLPMPMLAPLMLRPQTMVPFPRLNPAGQVLNLSMVVPWRTSDPTDPAQKSYQQIVGLLETLPSNFPFKAELINAVPKPVTVPAKVGTTSFGFEWGVSPLFDVKKIIPLSYSFGIGANAKYVLKLADQVGTGLKLGLFAGGDFKGEIKFDLGEASAESLQLQGNVMFGIQGNF